MRNRRDKEPWWVVLLCFILIQAIISYIAWSFVVKLSS